jgi:hypothetical protein
MPVPTIKPKKSKSEPVAEKTGDSEVVTIVDAAPAVSAPECAPDQVEGSVPTKEEGTVVRYCVENVERHNHRRFGESPFIKIFEDSESCESAEVCVAGTGLLVKTITSGYPSMAYVPNARLSSLDTTLPPHHYNVHISPLHSDFQKLVHMLHHDWVESGTESLAEASAAAQIMHALSAVTLGDDMFKTLTKKGLKVMCEDKEFLAKMTEEFGEMDEDPAYYLAGLVRLANNFLTRVSDFKKIKE